MALVGKCTMAIVAASVDDDGGNLRDDKTSAGIVLYRIVDDAVQYLMLRSPQGNWLPPKGTLQSPVDVFLQAAANHATASIC